MIRALDDLVTAADLARRLGILTATLAKWRRLGKGPSTWVYTSKNRVAYPKDAVERFMASLPAKIHER